MCVCQQGQIVGIKHSYMIFVMYSRCLSGCQIFRLCFRHVAMVSLTDSLSLSPSVMVCTG